MIICIVHNFYMELHDILDSFWKLALVDVTLSNTKIFKGKENRFCLAQAVCHETSASNTKKIFLNINERIFKRLKSLKLKINIKM